MKKKLIITCIIGFVFFSLLSVNAFASNVGITSSNIGNQNYLVRGEPVKSYLAQNGDGSFTRVENIYTKIIAEQYDGNKVFQSGVEIPIELSDFGGYYSGKDYNFFVFGQDNPSEDNSAEVFRVVKYSKSWERLGQASLSNCNTIVPFVAGSLRMAEDNGILYIRTAHQMYKTDDGLNHQANITFSLDISNMKIIEANSDITNISTGYVSHSFNQFIIAENGKFATLDHGDAYPRSLTLITYTKNSNGLINVEKFTDLLTFAGEIGENNTNASAGGFEASDCTYLSVGNSTKQKSVNEGTRNIFLCVNSSDDITQQQFKWLTYYNEDGNNYVSTPQLVKVNENRYLIMWYEYDKETLKYVLTDKYGNLLSDVTAMNANLSDCKPIASGNKVIWYTTNNSAPVFYEIDASTISASAVLNSVKMSIDGYPIMIEAYNINGNNYFKLRDMEYVTMAFGRKPFAIRWNAEESRITLETDIVYEIDPKYITDSYYIDGDSECKAFASSSSVFLNDNPVDVSAFNINGNNYFNLRDLCQQLNYEVGWNEQTKSITLKTK